MPEYNEGSPPPGAPVLNPGILITVWNNEVVPASGAASPPDEAASQQVSLRREQHYPSVLSVEVRFAADPGTFQVDLQTADTDADPYYVSKANVAAVNASFVGRIEAINVVAKFARLRMTTLTNAVAVTATIS